MLGMEYQCQQYYSYQNIKQLQEILNVDQIGFVNIYEDESIIEYKIDRSKHLRLSDLIYMIQYKFVRFHLGQLLTLFTKLLKQVILLQTQYQIQHSYLDQNRIWLIFQDSNQYISVVYNKIDYTIAFTGYQCQLYEKGSNKTIPANEKIQMIINNILKQFQKNNMYFNDSIQIEIKKYIYDPIIQACDQLDIKNTLNKIQGILQSYKFDSEQQTIKQDDSSASQNVDIIRKQNINLIKQQMKDYINVLKEEPTFIMELIILTQIQNMTVTLENSKQKFQKIEQDDGYFKAMKSIYEENYNQLKNNTQNMIQLISKETLQKKLEDYKFEILEEEKQKLIESSLIRILHMKLNKYFQNSPHYHLKNNYDYLSECQLSLQTKFLQQIVDEEVQMLIQYRILLLIDELI